MRKASIINFKEVKTSGYTTRKLSLLCMNTVLDYDNHDCGSRNYMSVYIDSKKTLQRLNNRYYNDGEEDILIHGSDTHLIGETINLRSPITCCSHNGKICRKCYGELSKINNNIHVGILGVTYLTSQLTQSMLSAKHLLKTNSEKINWDPEFLKYFNVSSNSISISQDLENASQYYLSINEEDINESGDGEFGQSIRKFTIVQRSKEKRYYTPITTEKDLFLSDFMEQMLDYKGIKDEEGNRTICLKDLDENEETLFYIEIENNELSKHLHSILNLIDNKDHLDVSSKEDLLQKFLELLNEAGIHVDSVHIENIVREILRDPNNITKRPDWTQKDAQYEILRVSDAIMNSDSIIISLSFEKIKKQFYEPETYEKTADSYLDSLFK